MEYGTDAYYQAKAAMHDVKITESKGVKTITETSDDGMTKKTTVMSEKDGMYQEREESYATIDGKKIRQKEVIVETYNDTSCMQIKQYDKSGKDAYREEGYTLDENGNYQLSYVDVKILEQTGNNAGNVFKGDKQWKYASPNDNKINNDLPVWKYVQDGKEMTGKTPTYVTNGMGIVVSDGKGGQTMIGIQNYQEFSTGLKGDTAATNRISTQGCFLTMLADHYSYESGRKYTPQNMNIMGDAKGAYQGVNTVPGKMLEKTGYRLDFQDVGDNYTIEDAQGLIEDRLLDSKPTGIMVDAVGNTHFLSITGARYDAKGNVTKYYTSDPGTANSNYDYIDKSTMQYTPDVKNRRSNPRKVTRILYMTKTGVK